MKEPTYIHIPRNFRFPADVDRKLWDTAHKAGKTMTMVVNDYVLDRRQFDGKTESILADAVEKGEDRKAYIEKAIQFYAKETSELTAKESAALGLPAPLVGKKVGRSKS